MITRRGCLCAAGTLLGARAGLAAEAPIPSLPLGIHVAGGDAPVVDDAWLEDAIAEANRLLGPQSISVARAWRRPLAQPGVLETATDRDALGKLLVPDVINVFVVASLRDIDFPLLMRRGVRWRLRRDVHKSYLIVSAVANDTVLCHELGHELGLPHSFVVDNVMSYRREHKEKLTFDAAQGRIMRRTARALWAAKRLKTPEKA